MILGNARVSTNSQNPDGQVDARCADTAGRIFSEAHRDAARCDSGNDAGGVMRRPFGNTMSIGVKTEEHDIRGCLATIHTAGTDGPRPRVRTH